MCFFLHCLASKTLNAILNSAYVRVRFAMIHTKLSIFLSFQKGKWKKNSCAEFLHALPVYKKLLLCGTLSNIVRKTLGVSKFKKLIEKCEVTLAVPRTSGRQERSRNTWENNTQQAGDICVPSYAGT